MKTSTFVKSLLVVALTVASVCSSAFAWGKKTLPPVASQPAAMPTDAGTEAKTALPVTQQRRPLPVYLSELSNINDYALFANGGWDGNWYVGSNVCWIEQFPQIPAGRYRKVFIGAKVGRAKTQNTPDRPAWEKENIPGDIYIALASTPAWKASQGYFLTGTEDVPSEPDWENALEGTGESRWFWREVPLSAVTFDGPNYVAVWSPTMYFISAASSPILASGWGSKKINSWMNNEIKGYPPIDPVESIKTAITVFEPAIAMKLIPEGTAQDITVSIEQVMDGRERTANKTFICSVTGDSIERAWLEVYAPKEKIWKKHGRAVYAPPYSFTLNGDLLPVGIVSVRCSAVDMWGNSGSSAPAEITVSR